MLQKESENVTVKGKPKYEKQGEGRSDTAACRQMVLTSGACFRGKGGPLGYTRTADVISQLTTSQQY